MKILVKITNQCVSTYNKSTDGKEFISIVDSLEDGYNIVANREDGDFYPQEDGFVLSGSGSEVFDPNYPDTFDFGDYSYYITDVDTLDSYDDAALIRAIEADGDISQFEVI